MRSRAIVALCTGLVLVFAASAFGCGDTNKCGGIHYPAITPEQAAAHDAEESDATYLPLWQVLRATDARVAPRGSPAVTDADRTHAVNGAIAREMVIGVWDGGPDAFAASYRQSLLALVDKAPPIARNDTMWALRLELARARLESNLPWGASRLIEAQVASFTLAATEKIAAERDSLLAKHLREITASLQTDEFDALAAHELDDWLDPLEKLLAGYTQTEAALAELRVGLTRFDTRPTLARAADLQLSLSAMLQAHTRGATVDFRLLETKLREALAAIKIELGASIPSAFANDEIVRLATPLFVQQPGVARVLPASASPATSPERQEPRAAVEARATGDAKMRLAGTLALRLFVEQGLVAIQLVVDRKSHKSIQFQDRWTRHAAARPAECIVAAIEAALAFGKPRIPGDFEEFAIYPRSHH